MAKHHRGNLLKISEVANKAGVLSSTIRYYSDIGLLKVASETPGGHRLYEEENTLSAIKRIQFLSKQGFTMEQIKQELTSGGKKKVLVIDDEADVRDFVSEAVTSGFPNIEVKAVQDGFAAGRILSEYLPDLIILDLMLPGVDGFEVCRQIRSMDFLRGVKIIAVSGYGSPDNREKIIACGANDFIAKPMDLQTLKSKIASLLDIAPEKSKTSH